MINPTRVRKIVDRALCDHDYKPTAVGEIANTETCFKCFTTRFIFHDEPHHSRHLVLATKKRLHIITDIRRPKPKGVVGTVETVEVDEIRNVSAAGGFIVTGTDPNKVNGDIDVN